MLISGADGTKDYGTRVTGLAVIVKTFLMPVA
jgi:hypothetical protein